jgi:general secretion pathway protein G
MLFTVFKKNRHGFTLVELLVVVVILGILVTFAAREYTSTIEDAKLATLKKNLSTIRSQIEAFASDKGYYPTALTDLTQGQKPYLAEIPIDPMTNNNDWQVAPPSINIADLSFFVNAGFAAADSPKVTISGTMPEELITGAQTFSKIIDNEDSDFLSWKIPSNNATDPLTFPNYQDMFGGSEPVIKLEFPKITTITGVKIIFYSVPKVKYRVTNITIGSITRTNQWALNDTFYLDLQKGRPVKTNSLTISFSAFKATNLEAQIRIGISSVEVYEGTAPINTADDKTVVPGNKWYSKSAWDNSNGDFKSAVSFGIGQIRSSKTGFYNQ